MNRVGEPSLPNVSDYCAHEETPMILFENNRPGWPTPWMSFLNMEIEVAAYNVKHESRATGRSFQYNEKICTRHQYPKSRESCHLKSYISHFVQIVLFCISINFIWSPPVTSEMRREYNGK